MLIQFYFDTSVYTSIHVCEDVHSQKRHRLAASCEFYPLAASCQQVAASLLTSSSCSKSVKSDLLQLDICRLAASCCNNLQQACGQQVLTSLIEQLAASLLNTSMLIQAAKIRLVATWYLLTCCKLLKQLASSLWITSLDKSVLAICSKSVERIKLHQVCENQTCCNLIFSDLLQIAETTCLSEQILPNNKSCQSNL